ncbi:hypothetical protein NA57DRAFT_62392 [Rhizodiscina lignyota]|uniref:Uncharacterized protein n=1 Tax=Rhizodiscina lignyota TaxID=1504668 RepID=A0A9P4I2Y2_9PEZI|nr:hypothetical protein NA57DRAFT_62392 [Rhizodiscina lignyota]
MITKEYNSEAIVHANSVGSLRAYNVAENAKQSTPWIGKGVRVATAGSSSKSTQQPRLSRRRIGVRRICEQTEMPCHIFDLSHLERSQIQAKQGVRKMSKGTWKGEASDPSPTSIGEMPLQTKEQGVLVCTARSPAETSLGIPAGEDEALLDPSRGREFRPVRKNRSIGNCTRKYQN